MHILNSETPIFSFQNLCFYVLKIKPKGLILDFSDNKI